MVDREPAKDSRKRVECCQVRPLQPHLLQNNTQILRRQFKRPEFENTVLQVDIHVYGTVKHIELNNLCINF